MSTSPLGYRAAPVAHGPAGTLLLSAASSGGRTQPVRTESQGILRLMKPLYLDDSGQLTYIVVNPGGAYFGESCRMEVEVGPDANLLLASQGATRIYRTPNAPAVQEARFQVADSARFEYVPEQVIAYRDADYRQLTTLVVTPQAQAFIGEIVTPGWDPDGQQFTYTAMRLRLDVREAGGALVCSDNVRVVPGELGEQIAGIGQMEGASHLGSVLIVGPHCASADYIDRVRALIAERGLERAGATTGAREGVTWLMVRALADSTEALDQLIRDINEFDRSVTSGQSRLDLRRY